MALDPGVSQSSYYTSHHHHPTPTFPPLHFLSCAYYRPKTGEWKTGERSKQRKSVILSRLWMIQGIHWWETICCIMSCCITLSIYCWLTWREWEWEDLVRKINCVVKVNSCMQFNLVVYYLLVKNVIIRHPPCPIMGFRWQEDGIKYLFPHSCM